MRLRLVVGAVGTLATAVAALAVLGAGLAPVADAFEPIVAALSELGPQGLVLATVAVAVLGFVVSLLVPGEERVLADDGATERFERLLDRPPEGVARATSRTGAALDDDVARAVAGDERALSAVRERLRDLARAALARRPDENRPPADRVASGEWTDDRTAAAFLADGDPPASLRSRVRLWLDPETERERRISRTAAALGRLTTEVTPPEVGAREPGAGDGPATGDERPTGGGSRGSRGADPHGSRDADAGGAQE